MDYLEMLANRIAELRIEKGASAREMSLDLALGESYINRIENRHALPSMEAFFYICDYFKITPEEFFSTDKNTPQKIKELTDEFKKLTPKQSEAILEVIREINKLN